MRQTTAVKRKTAKAMFGPNKVRGALDACIRALADARDMMAYRGEHPELAGIIQHLAREALRLHQMIDKDPHENGQSRWLRNVYVEARTRKNEARDGLMTVTEFDWATSNILLAGWHLNTGRQKYWRREQPNFSTAWTVSDAFFQTTGKLPPCAAFDKLERLNG